MYLPRMHGHQDDGLIIYLINQVNYISHKLEILSTSNPIDD